MAFAAVNEIDRFVRAAGKTLVNHRLDLCGQIEKAEWLLFVLGRRGSDVHSAQAGFGLVLGLHASEFREGQRS